MPPGPVSCHIVLYCTGESVGVSEIIFITAARVVLVAYNHKQVCYKIRPN